MYIHIHIYVCMYVCIYVYIYIYISTYICIHTHTHGMNVCLHAYITHTHTHTHTHKHLRRSRTFRKRGVTCLGCSRATVATITLSSLTPRHCCSSVLSSLSRACRSTASTLDAFNLPGPRPSPAPPPAPPSSPRALTLASSVSPKSARPSPSSSPSASMFPRFCTSRHRQVCARQSCARSRPQQGAGGMYAACVVRLNKKIVITGIQ